MVPGIEDGKRFPLNSIQKALKVAWCIAALLLIQACAPFAHPSEKRTTLYYETTRKPASHPPSLDKYYSGEGDDSHERPGRFGTSVVAVPQHNPPSESGAHISSYPTSFKNSGDFLNAVRARFKNETKPVVCYVHGFNNGFDAAAQRAGFFAQQLQPDVALTPLIYSWPSAGSVFRYPYDEESFMLDQDRLRDFLNEIGANVPKSGPGTANLVLFGHSLGCRALTLALRDIYRFRRDTKKLNDGPIFEHLVLLEPDVNNAYFSQHLGELRWLFKDITVYISPRDIALHLSGILHGFNRVGQDSFAELETTRHEGARLAWVDIINASALRSDIFGHSYDDPEFFHDLRLLIHHKNAAERVGQTLSPKDCTTGIYALKR